MQSNKMQVNKDFRIKLIVSPWFEDYEDFFSLPAPFLPYGIGVVTAYLRNNGCYVEQEDLAIKFNHYKYDCYSFAKHKLNLNIDKYKRYIHDYMYASSRDFHVEQELKLDLLIQKVLDSTVIDNFNLIGFSVSDLFQFIFTILLSKKIKERANIPIVLGGCFITLYGQLYSSVFKFIDYMIIGDGQVPLLKLIAHLEGRSSISDIPNLVFNYKGKIMGNPFEFFSIEDMPVPDFDGLPVGLYKTSGFGKDISLPYQITRGCTSRCSFCPHVNKYRKLDFKSYGKVLSELKEMKKRYNSNQFILSDLAINNSYEYLNGLLDLIIKNRLNIIWNSYLKIDKHIDKRLLDKMKKAGCALLYLGIESGSDRMLKMMNKGFTSEMASKALRDISEFKIKTLVHLLVGYPYETQQDINQTAEFIRKNKKYIYSAWVAKFLLLYGSIIYNNADSYKITNLISFPLRRHIFYFDELNGSTRNQIRKRSADNYRVVSRSVYKYILLRPRMDILYNIISYLLNIVYFCLSGKLFLRKENDIF